MKPKSYFSPKWEQLTSLLFVRKKKLMMLKETCRGFGLFFSNDLCYSRKLALFGLFVWYKKEGSLYSRNRAFSLNNSLQTYQNLPFFLTKFFYLGEIVIFVVQAHVKSDELIQNLLVKQTAKTLKIFCFSFLLDKSNMSYRVFKIIL